MIEYPELNLEFESKTVIGNNNGNEWPFETLLWYSISQVRRRRRNTGMYQSERFICCCPMMNSMMAMMAMMAIQSETLISIWIYGAKFEWPMVWHTVIEIDTRYTLNIEHDSQINMNATFWIYILIAWTRMSSFESIECVYCYLCIDLSICCWPEESDRVKNID